MGIESVNLAQNAQPIKTKNNLAQVQSFGSSAVADVPDTYQKSTASKRGFLGFLIGGSIGFLFEAAMWKGTAKYLKDIGRKATLSARLTRAGEMIALAGAAGALIGVIMHPDKNKAKK